MKLTILQFTAIAFAFIAKPIQAAPSDNDIFPTTLPILPPPKVQALGSAAWTEDPPKEPFCSPPHDICDLSLLQLGRDHQSFNLALGVNCDMTPIAVEYVSQKHNLEEFILQFLGNFNMMNILWGPLLQAPFFDPDVRADDLEVYKQRLFSVIQGTDETPCATSEYEQADGVPYGIGFPLYDSYNGVDTPTPASVRSTWWTMDYTRSPMHAQYDMNTNASPSCDKETFSYNQAVSKTTSATSSHSISEEFEFDFESKTTAEVNAKFMGIGASMKEEITVGFSNTIAASWSESSTVTHSTTTAVSNKYEAKLPPYAVSNITQYVDQVHATLGYTNDVRYNDSQPVKTYTSLQKQAHFGHSNHTATMGEVKELVIEAADLLGVKFSEFFEDVITTASISGKAATTQGMAVSTLHNGCDLNAVHSGHLPPNECTDLEALAYPPRKGC
eukprot:Clim_evm82s33 gene=Clim_evmTU82s33